MTNFVDPEPTNWPKAKIEKFAADARDEIGFRTGASLKKTIKDLGGNISYTAEQHDDAESGSLIAKSYEDFTIHLSPNTSIERDNFTLAHELAHLAMHFGEKPMRATRYVKDDPISRRAEWEANWFAAEFLMPSDEFNKIWTDLSGDLRLVAAHFNVSRPAARIRASVLGLLSD